jgi:ectoine hydroxylase-related dioxygenase (phytanoyl-CoA dioxygenase family)
MGTTAVINRQAYNEKGYVLLRRFFAAEEVDRVRDEAKRIFISQMSRLGIVDGEPTSEAAFDRGMYALFQADLQAFTNCGKHAQHLISLHRLSLDDRIVGLLRTLGLEFPNISTRPVLYFNSPRLAKKEVYNRLEAHQDWRSMQGSLDSVVVWVPLVDIDRALGALEVLPGSHTKGLLPAEMEDGYGHLAEPVDRSSFVPIEVARGDVLVFSTFLVHQSGNNVTDGIRWSCHFRYNNMSDPTFIARGLPHPYIYKPMETLLTPGFPTSGQVEKVFA